MSDPAGVFARGIEAWNAQDADGFVAVTHPEVVWHPATTSALSGSQDAYAGHDGIRRWWNEMHDAFADLHNEVRDIRLVTADTVLALVTGHGRGRAAGVPVDWDFAMLVEFREGLVIRGRSWFDVDEGIRAAEALAQSREAP